MKRIIMGLAAAALVSSGLGLSGLGTAHADPEGDWGPARHWCPGELPVPATGNHVTDPLNWDWTASHTYYFVWPGMGNVSNLIWDGDNPPPKPPPPVGLYCEPGTMFRHCWIGDHP